ncbi:hypothetical protein BH11MYX4_BH11MYX4_30800 [soil metagenome]
MTAARKVVPNETHLMTRRCTQRQMLLRPERRVEEIFLYCLALAAERYGLTIHGFIAMSNHEHFIVRDNRGNYPEFLAYHHRLVAMAMNALRGRRENFWAAEQPSAVRLVEPADRFAKLVYLLANPVAADLVDCVSDWPGASSFKLHLSSQTKTIKRPRGFFRADGAMPAEVTLRIERPAGFEVLTDEEWTTKLANAVRAEEERARAARRARAKRVLGRKAILRAAPTDTPKSLERRGTLRPRIACQNRELRIAELAALARFRAERRLASRRLLAGEHDVVFPYGTYRVRGFFLTKPPPSLAA